MSQEILYTSAAEGLKAGSRGFCTVVSTAGMAKNLADRLESLSGYRHAFETHDPRAKYNPVNFQHLIASVGGRKLHILSRICDAGFDYTKRSNKLAHHIAMEPAEALAATGGPAWVMTSPGFFQTAWDGETKILPNSRPLRADACPTRVCSRWKRVAAQAGDAGDEGWAGVLAENARTRGGKPMSVIYPVGVEPLPLVVEALSLLPQAQRWQVTFSTYFTKLPVGLECQWRFVFDGSPEAEALRRNPHAPLIDLCKPLGPAPESELVLVARRGIAPLTAPPKAQASAPLDAVSSDASEPGRETLAREANLGVEELTLAPPERTGRALRGGLPTDDLLNRRLQTAQKRTSPLVFIMGGLTAFLLIVVLGLVAYIATRGGNSGNNKHQAVAATAPPAEPVSSNNDELAAKTAAKASTAADKKNAEIEKADEEKADEEKADEEKADEEKADEEKADEEKADEDEKAAKEKATADKAAKERKQQLAFPFSALKKEPYRLVIPTYKIGGGPAAKVEQDKKNKRLVPLGVIYNESPQDVSMELLGAEILQGSLKRLEIKQVDDKKGDNQRVWEIFTTAGISKQQLLIAKLTLKGEELLFRWEPDKGNKTTSQRKLLPFHALKIKIAHGSKAAAGNSTSSSTQICQLIEPHIVQIAKIAWRSSNHSLVDNPESLHLPEWLKDVIPAAKGNVTKDDAAKGGRDLYFSTVLALESPVKNNWKTSTLAGRKYPKTIMFFADDENDPSNDDAGGINKAIEMEWWIKPTVAGAEIRYRFAAYAPNPVGDLSNGELTDRIVISHESVTKKRLREFGTDGIIKTYQHDVDNARKAFTEAEAKLRKQKDENPDDEEKIAGAKQVVQEKKQHLKTARFHLQVAQNTPIWKKYVEKTLDAICTKTKVRLVQVLNLEPGVRVVLARSVEAAEQPKAL